MEDQKKYLNNRFDNLLCNFLEESSVHFGLLPQNHKVHIYLQYHSVCSLVGIGTPLPPSPASGVPPPPPQGTKGGDTLACG
jgi:hypothetical protein